MITRIVLYLTLATVLYGIGLSIAHPGFWAILALFWASEHATKIDTHEYSFVQGILTYINMTETEQRNLRNKINELETHD